MNQEQQTIETWTRGDYAVVESWIAPASRAVLGAVDFGARPSMLDVACGMGTVAIEAATRGALVTGLDLTPNMLAEARRRANLADVSVRWVQGAFDNLSALGAFDLVTSAFGVIFAADPEAVAQQLSSACLPGGRIVLTAWQPDGVFGGAGIVKVRELAPDLPEGPSPDRWAREAGLRSLFDGTAMRLEDQQPGELLLPFASVPAAFDQMLAHSGPWQQLMAYLESLGKAELARAAVEDHLASFAVEEPEGGIQLRVSYVVSTLERA